MLAFDSIILARFPLTDLPGDKRRPAFIASRDNHCRADLVACLIASAPRAEANMGFGVA